MQARGGHDPSWPQRGATIWDMPIRRQDNQRSLFTADLTSRAAGCRPPKHSRRRAIPGGREQMSTEGDAPVSSGQEAQVPTPAGHGRDLLQLAFGAANPHSSSEVEETTADDRRGDGGLVSALCRALEDEHVSYCHWKSNEALDRSVIADNDLDLLVSRSDTRRFEEILKRLGFKDAQPPRWKQLPGIWHSYALDRKSGELVHVHAHYQLVIGDDMTKNYRLPIEEPYLASAVVGTPFRIPTPEFEFAVFLVRMVVKHCTWDALLCLQGSLSPSERRELTYLVRKVDPGDVWAVMGSHLPFLHRELWEACLRAVQPGSSIWLRIKTASQLQRTLVACSRRPRAVDTYLRMATVPYIAPSTTVEAQPRIT